MCQHDLEGRWILQHRGRAKWTVSGANRRVPGFVGEDQAFSFLDRLRGQWGVATRTPGGAENVGRTEAAASGYPPADGPVPPR
jgi:hypothetical protein